MSDRQTDPVRILARVLNRIRGDEGWKRLDDADGRWSTERERLAAPDDTGVETRLPEPVPADPVFDFTGIERVDVSSLALLLTAGHLAHEDDRNVWVTGVPEQAWDVLQALGLESFFLPFPGSRDAVA